MDDTNSTNPALRVKFRCSCGHSFATTPGRTEDCPGRPNHPYGYFADCPECDNEASQAPWEIALYNSMGHQTGPKTPAGKAASASNLSGHPTPEEAQRTRFNALKHGLSAKTATFFPAKYGHYPFCHACDVDIATCLSHIACMRQMITSAVVEEAFASGDPSKLMALNAGIQSSVHGLIQNMISAIAADGVSIKTPEYTTDKDGTAGRVIFDGEQIYKLQAHPLLKTLSDYISKNNLTLSDMAMTPKGHDETKTLEGHLANQQTDRESMLDYQKRQTQASEELLAMVERGRAQTRKDPILIEHQTDEQTIAQGDPKDG